MSWGVRQLVVMGSADVVYSLRTLSGSLVTSSSITARPFSLTEAIPNPNQACRVMGTG